LKFFNSFLKKIFDVKHQRDIPPLTSHMGETDPHATNHDNP